MKTVLHIKSSGNIKGGVTRQVGQVALERLKAQNPGLKVIERDLVKNPLPHIGPEFVEAIISLDDKAKGLALSNQLIDELIASDILLIEAPMYNFSIPSVLKAWVDHVVRKQKTFQYTEKGPQGLLKGKKAILIFGSGGVYSDGPAKVLDFETGYLRTILNFIGIADIDTIHVEGVGMGPEKAAAALQQGKTRAGALA